MNLTALIVDDESCNRQPLATFLKALGYNVMEAADGQEGLQVYQANQHNIDVIITDFQMPHLDGRQMLTEIKKLGTNVKTIMITGMATGKPEIDAKDFPEPMTVLGKPFSFGSIITTFKSFQLATA